MGKAVTECYSWYNNSVVGKYIPDDKGVCSESFNELRVSVHCNTMDNNVSNGIGVALEATIDGVNWVNLRKECISDSFYMDRFFWKALRFVTYATLRWT
jgi:hypothetical protein